MATEYDFACERHDGRLVVRGDCGVTTAKRFGEQIAAFDGGPVEIDLKGVTFFDSAALRVLLAARERNPELRLGDMSQDVALVLKISGTYPLLCRPGAGSAPPVRGVATA
jgi:anti-anti-sigma factor